MTPTLTLKRTLAMTAAVCALAAGAAGCAAVSNFGSGNEGGGGQVANSPVRPGAPTPALSEANLTGQAPTVAEAVAFVEDAERQLAEASEYAGRVAWARATNITYETMWLEAKANADYTEL